MRGNHDILNIMLLLACISTEVSDIKCQQNISSNSTSDRPKIQAYFLGSVIRIPIRNFSISFGSSDFLKVMKGSLLVEGTRKPYSIVAMSVNSLVDREIVYYVAKGSGLLRKGTLFSKENLLVQDYETKRYIFLDNDRIEYTTIPNANANVFIFLEEPWNRDMTFTYSTVAISWKVQHTLFLPIGDSTSCILRSDAIIENNNITPFQFDDIELIATEIPLFDLYMSAARMTPILSISIGQPCPKSSPYLNLETLGVLRYKPPIKNVLIPGKGYLKVPLPSIPIDAVNVAFFEFDLVEGVIMKNFQRSLRLTSRSKVPPGKLMVMDNNGYVANGVIPQLPSRFSYSLQLGIDPNLICHQEISFYNVSQNSANRSVYIKYQLKNSNHQIGSPIEITLINKVGVILNVKVDPDFTGTITYKKVVIRGRLPPDSITQFHVTMNILQGPSITIA